MRSKKIWLGLFGAVLVTGFVGASSARDIPKTDPNRMPILDAARESPGEKFAVKDLFTADNMAYLCVLPMSLNAKGVPVYDGTDGSYDVRLLILRKANGKWSLLKRSESFAASPGSVDCKVNGRELRDKNDIVKAMDQFMDPM